MARITELQPIAGSQTKTNDLFVTVNLESGELGTKNITRKELVKAIQQETFDEINANGGNLTNVVLRTATSFSQVLLNQNSIGGTLNKVEISDSDITTSRIENSSITNPTISGGTLGGSTFNNGTITNTDIRNSRIFDTAFVNPSFVDPDIDITKSYTPDLADLDYFIVKNVLNDETVKITFDDLQTEIAKALQKATKIYVDGTVEKSGNGSYYKPYKTLEEAFEVLQALAADGNRASVSVIPGDHYTNGDLAIPDDCSVVSTNGQYATNIYMNPGYEGKNAFLVGSGCYVQGFAFRNQEIDNLDNPTGGFAVAFRPGATIKRSPYIRDCSQISNYRRETVAAPLDPRNSLGTLDDLGGDDFPNPLVGRGGGMILVDRAVLNQDTLFPYILAFGATPRSPNGIGYCAKNGAGINGIGSITIFQRCSFYALNGGQITLNNSGTQFGDISMRSNGSTNVVDPYQTATTNLKENKPLADFIFSKSTEIADATWNYLTVTEGFERYDSAKCKRDVGLILEGVANDIELGTNYWAVLNGLSYIRQSALLVIQAQLPETIGAIGYAQTKVAELIASHVPSLTASNTSFDEIKQIVAGGTPADIIFANTGNVNKVNARAQLQINKQLIITTVIAWINANFPGLPYDEVACARDLGYIIDGLSYDVNYSSNMATIANTSAYFIGTVSTLPTQQQKDATALAMTELGRVCGAAIQGSLLGQDVTNPFATIAEVNTVIQLTGIISTVITKDALKGTPGSSVLTDSLQYLPRRQIADKTWITDLELSNSKNKIDSNRQAIQRQTVQWTSAEFVLLDEALTKRDTGYLIRSVTYDLLEGKQTATRNFAAAFFDYKADRVFIPNGIYNYEKCYRDTKLITDAVTYDILFNSNFRSIKAARAYHRANASAVITEQLAITLDALARHRQQILNRVTGLAGGSPDAAARVNLRFDTIVDIIANGEVVAPAYTLPDPTGYSVDSFSGRQQILDNIGFIKAEIEAWIAINYPGLVGFYDVAKCLRDVELILEAIRYDITYGGNLETLTAGLSYFVGTNPQYGTNEREATLGAYERLSVILGDITRGIAITPSVGNIATQASVITVAPFGSIDVADFVQARVGEVIQIIETRLNRIPSRIAPTTEWAPATMKVSFDAIVADQILISNNVLEEINTLNKSLIGAFILSYDFIRQRMITLIEEAELTLVAPLNFNAEKTMINSLFIDIIKKTLLGPSRLRFGSLIESIAHQFNLAGAGVNKNALPLNFRKVGRPLPASGSVLQQNGGRVRWSGSDELNNMYFARGLKINGRTGRLEGRPFTSSVRRLARRAANSRTAI